MNKNKNAIILHGTGSNPNQFWFPYLRNKLENKGYSVWSPQLPEPLELKTWLPFVLNHANFNQDTVLVSHSAAGPLVLSILERIDTRIHQAIIVSGYIKDTEENPILQPSYNWEKIKSNCKHFYFINSDDDPWGCDDKQGRAMFDKLGGTLIIKHKAGHMGSESFKQPYKQFPLVLKLIETEE